MVKRDFGRHSCWISALAFPRLLTRALTVVNGSNECWVPTMIVFSLLEKLWFTSAPTNVLVRGLTIWLINCNSCGELVTMQISQLVFIQICKVPKLQSAIQKVKQNKQECFTLELVSTLISVVMLFLFNCVLTSARNTSPFFVPDDVIAYMVSKLRMDQM
ncbi:hypothetical protein Hanom_Chr14g01308081 [Helianthus anomalus]